MSDRLFKEDVLFLQRILRASGLYEGHLDGFWGPKTDKAMQEFETRNRELRDRFGELDARSEARILTLHLKAQEAARFLLDKIRKAGIDARMLSGTRSYSEQNELFRQGRFGDTRKKITNARGGQSNHNFGIAWDIGIFADGKYLTDAAPYKQAAEIGMADAAGLEWGGDWITFKDFPHYQIATGMAISDVREKFEKGQAFV